MFAERHASVKITISAKQVLTSDDSASRLLIMLRTLHDKTEVFREKAIFSYFCEGPTCGSERARLVKAALPASRSQIASVTGQ